MRLFLLPPSFDPSSPLCLTGKDFNYLINALRLGEGQRLTGRDAAGNAWELKIEKVNSASCTLSARETGKAAKTTDFLPQANPCVPIILYQCIPKGRKLDDIIRMATEAGVLRIVPVRSRNCVADISSEREDSKYRRFNAVIREAIQQSGSSVPTCIDRTIDISAVPSHFRSFCSDEKLPESGTVRLFFHQKKLSENQKNLTAIVSPPCSAAAVLIGAEGGLSDEETSFLTKNCFLPVLLKTNILRCETAALYAIAATQILIEEKCQ